MQVAWGIVGTGSSGEGSRHMQLPPCSSGSSGFFAGFGGLLAACDPLW